MVWLPEKMVCGVLRFGLEESERLVNVGSIRTVAVVVYSQVACSFGRKSSKPLRLPNVSRGDAEFVAVPVPQDDSGSSPGFPSVARTSRAAMPAVARYRSGWGWISAQPQALAPRYSPDAGSAPPAPGPKDFDRRG
jgi:hypothetical protein